MQEAIYITTSTVICNGSVYKDGQLVFEDQDQRDPTFLMALYRRLGLNYPKFFKMDNLARLGWVAAEILLEDHPGTGNYKPEQVGIVFQNANSSLDADLRYIESVKEIASPALFVYTLSNIVIGEICIKHKFKGETAFFIFESFDAGFLEKYVSNLINSNILQACICGWVELIGDEYTGVVFLIESGPPAVLTAPAGAIAFNTENLNKIYQLRDG